ncbi:PREDICTED: uncharacterized protein LOC104809602 isoform X2 [Tarenaya hassleriana]|uniref:uncharacterized protein LOC104809602 isoform X2 n=1 Tax=Tarenaya hassleriana TaxID=28532 RepID=UPI00053C71F3|nr:PREDICTED: uncharacterized protein LOC104809602 isoform X2 [Tarenaya hassleriana]
MYHTQHNLPCLHCQPHSYIRMVHQLIERCIMLQMTRDQCVEALAEHASIRPLVTLTVWRELQKENKEFFQTYQDFVGRRPFPSGHAQRKSHRFARRKR